MTTVRMDLEELTSIGAAVEILEKERALRIAEHHETKRVRLREAAEDVAETALRGLPKTLASKSLESPPYEVLLKGDSELERAAMRPLLDLAGRAGIILEYGKFLDEVESCVIYVEPKFKMGRDLWKEYTWPERA